MKIRLASVFMFSAFVACLTAAADPALAVGTEYHLDIPKQPLDTALADFARQTGLQVAGLSKVLADGSSVGPLKGQYSVQDALDSLLHSHGLTFSVVAPRTIAVITPEKSKSLTLESSKDSSPEAPTTSGSAPLFLAGPAAAPSEQSVRPPMRLAQTSTGGGAESAPAGASNATSEVVVTGSHIQQTGMNTPTPVTVLSADELQQNKPGPIIEALSEMPQFLNNSTPGNSYSFTSGSGQSFLNMRGLGINRTLVLLDGRRVTPSSRLGATDVSIFPQALISKVDVVTGGTSAVYGTDAIAGVANFVLNTKFNGLEVNGLGGITSRGDNGNYGASIAFGTGIGEHFHIIGSTEIYRADRVESFDGRDWYNGTSLVQNPNPTGPRQLTLPNVTSTRYTDGGLIVAPRTPLNNLMFLPDGSTTPFVPGSIGCQCGIYSQSGGIGYNYKADRSGEGSLYPDYGRQSSFLYANYDFNERTTAYVQLLYGHGASSYVMPGAVQYSQWQGTIYSGNPYLPANIQGIMTQNGIASFGLSRVASSADLNLARAKTANSLFSPTIGLKGELAGWQYNAYYQDGRNQSDTFLSDYPRTDRLSLAMDAVVNPANGAIVCNSTLHNPTNGCVPINLLGAGRVTPQALSYVLGDKLGFATVHQRFAELSANKEIFQGWGAGPVALALGASWRRDSLSQSADPADGTLFVPQNDPANGIRGIPGGFVGNNFVHQFSGFPSLSGAYSAKEGYGEMLIPLLTDRPFFRQLNLSLAGRFADYSGSGGIWAYKGGIDWQMIDSFRLRTTLSHDVRAADLAERFDNQLGSATVTDPTFNGATYTLSQYSKGNPNVNPEEATTITAGFVFTPTFLPGFQASLDYYNISNKDAISQLGAQVIINDCAAGVASYCALISRDPLTHQLLFVQNQYLNVAKQQVTGADAELDYTHGISLFGNAPEKLSARVIGSWLGTNSITNQVGTINYAGDVGFQNRQNLPRLQIVSKLTYTNGPWQVAAIDRFIGRNAVDVMYTQGVQIDDNVVGTVSYVDFDASYTHDWSDHGSTEVYLHVTNALDRAPPLDPDYTDFTGALQYNQTVYDVLGRRFTLGVRLKF